MKTVGERIRQARDARGLSGEELARAVGYKHQSAISNLENRSTGTGGIKIAQIATALRVPVRWLLEGPDSLEVPLQEPIASKAGANSFSIAGAEINEKPTSYTPDGSLAEALHLFRLLSMAARVKAISYMQYLASEDARTSEESNGNRDPVPHQKAA